MLLFLVKVIEKICKSAYNNVVMRRRRCFNADAAGVLEKGGSYGVKKNQKQIGVRDT